MCAWLSWVRERAGVQGIFTEADGGEDSHDEVEAADLRAPPQIGSSQNSTARSPAHSMWQMGMMCADARAWSNNTDNQYRKQYHQQAINVTDSETQI